MLYVFFVIISLLQLALGHKNNVCRTYLDYATKSANPKCWYNPDVTASPSFIIKRNGYHFESYNIVTEDGYILGLFRIPHNNTDVGKRRQPVYLAHGIAVSSITWFDHGPRSLGVFLAFALSDEGYDVWMTNNRGTRYSQGHLKYTINDKRYWNFTWDEIAHYDTPANLNFIKKTTGKKVVYIGYSLGSTVSYVFASERKTDAQKLVKGIISMAPAATFNGSTNSAILFQPFEPALKIIFKTFGVAAAFNSPKLQELIRITCSNFPTLIVCVFLLLTFVGFNNDLAPEDVPVFFSAAPDASPITHYLHLAQVYYAGRFQKYDYGLSKNLRLYGSPKPPEYDLGEIDLCVHLFFGRNDVIITTRNPKALATKLKCSTLNQIADDDDPPYNHLSFIYGRSVKSKLYPILFEKIKNITKDVES